MSFPGHPRGSAEYWRLLWALFAVGIGMFAQLYAPQPILPLLAEDLGVSPSSAALTVSMATMGLAVCVVPLSVLSDRLRRVRTITLGLAGGTLMGLLTPLAPSFELLLLARVLEGGLLGAVPAVTLAYLNEEVSRIDAARAAGVYVAGSTIGGLAGRLITAPLAEAFGWRAGVVAVALLCGMATAAFRVLAPASRRFTPSKLTLTQVTGRLRSVFTRRLVTLYLQGALLMGGFVGVYNFISFRLTGDPFRLSSTVTAFIFLAYLAGTVTSSLAGQLTSRVGRLPLLLASSAVMAAGVVMTASAHLWLVIAGMLLTTGGYFAAHTTASAWAGFEAVGARAQAASVYNVFFYTGSSLFGWAVGLPFHAAGWTAAAAMVLVLIAAASSLALLNLRGEPAQPAAQSSAGA